jgi:hypothetical protein
LFLSDVRSIIFGVFVFFWVIIDIFGVFFWQKVCFLNIKFSSKTYSTKKGLRRTPCIFSNCRIRTLYLSDFKCCSILFCDEVLLENIFDPSKIFSEKHFDHYLNQQCFRSSWWSFSLIK